VYARLAFVKSAAVEAAPTGKLELKGFARPVAAYEVIGIR
jgi:class 3 adenylate cyclase